MRPAEQNVPFLLYQMRVQATEDSGGDEPYRWMLGFKVHADTLGPPPVGSQFGPALSTELTSLPNGGYDGPLGIDPGGKVAPAPPGGPELALRLVPLGSRLSREAAVTADARLATAATIEMAGAITASRSIGRQR